MKNPEKTTYFRHIVMLVVFQKTYNYFSSFSHILDGKCGILILRDSSGPDGNHVNV